MSAIVENTGTRAGDEVVQLYLRDVTASVARPMQELMGFARVSLPPGASTRVSFTVRRSQMRFLDANMREVWEPGVWRVLVGASSRDIRLRQEVTVP